jgi:hypothetical protein
LLDDAQKNHQRIAAIEMLILLREQEEAGFDGIATGNESWFPRGEFLVHMDNSVCHNKQKPKDLSPCEL